MPDTQPDRGEPMLEVSAPRELPATLKRLDCERIDPLQLALSRGARKMTLEDVLAAYLYLQVVDTLGEREERICDAAWKIIESQARKAIGSFP